MYTPQVMQAIEAAFSSGVSIGAVLGAAALLVVQTLYRGYERRP